MRPRSKSLLAGLTVVAVACAGGTATAAPIGETNEPSGPFHAVLQVYPHSPDAAQIIFTNAATRDPEAARAFIRFVTGDEPGAVPTCPGGDIANCDINDFLDEDL